MAVDGINIWRPSRKVGVTVRSTRLMIQPECGECAGWNGTGRLNLSRETNFSGANRDRKTQLSLLS